jgi:pimeloyl-ACP methyl ester carboxylesterase
VARGASPSPSPLPGRGVTSGSPKRTNVGAAVPFRCGQAASVTAVKERFVDAAGARLFVTERGPADRPLVVLVHGYPDTHGCWDELAERLEAAHRVVAYDTRGIGRSTAPAGPGAHTLPKLAGDLAAVIEAVAGAEGPPVHLVGHDWGAFQCWQTAADPRIAPRIASLTTVAGPRVQTAPDWVRRRLRHPTRRALGELAGQARRSWYVGFFQLPWVPERVVPRVMASAWPTVLRRLEGVEPRAGHPAPTLARDAAHGIALYRENAFLLGPAPPPVEAPVQLVIPTRDRFISRALYAEAESWARHVRRRELAAGHWVQRSHPAELAGWVAEFVAGAGAGAGTGTPRSGTEAALSRP